MQGTGKWIMGGLMALMGLIGLFVAARGGDNPVAYYGGLGFFAFAVLVIMWWIKSAFDHAERGGRH